MSPLRDRRSFPGLLADLREHAGWSQSRLAVEAGLDSSYLCVLEKGKRHPSVDTVAVLAAVLSLTPADTTRLYLSAALLPPGRWVVLDRDADVLIRAAQEGAA